MVFVFTKFLLADNLSLHHFLHSASYIVFRHYQKTQTAVNRLFRVVVNVENNADFQQPSDIAEGLLVTASDFIFFNIMPAERNSCGNARDINRSVNRQNKNTLNEIALRFCFFKNYSEKKAPF